MSAKQYDTLTDAELTRLAWQALDRYPAQARGELRLLCRSENATFLVSAGGRRYALRLHRGDYHQKQEIESELQWLDALRESGMTVPEAVSDAEGKRVQTLALARGGERYAVLFHWIEGEMPTTSVDPRAFRELGIITARLHRHSRRWQRPEGFRRIIWDHHSMTSAHSHWGDWRDAIGLPPEGREVVEQAIDRVGARLAEYGKAESRYGLIHADLRLTNLLHHRGDTRVIDFDDCGMGWYLHDLAAAISFVEHHPRAQSWVDNWLQGYEQEAHLEDADLAHLPTLLIQRRIQLTAWVASHADTKMAQSLGPDWVSHTVRLCHRYMESDTLPPGA